MGLYFKAIIEVRIGKGLNRRINTLMKLQMPPNNDKKSKESQNIENLDNDVRSRKCYILLANVLEKATCVKDHSNH